MSEQEKDNDKSLGNIQIKQDIPEQFESNVEAVKDYSERLSRDGELGFNNNSGNILLKRDGQITLSSQKDSHIKLSPTGNIESISNNKLIITNNLKIKADDISLNNHKFNNKLFELADFKNVLNGETAKEKTKVVGGLTMLGTVLTKTWDKYLKRYVLVRRLVNIPMFSPSMGILDVPQGLQLTPSAERITDMQNAYKKSGLDPEEYLKAYRESKKTSQSNKKEDTTKKESEQKKEPKSMTEVLTHQKA